uniref:Protein Wnt n=1 Tax=Falco tinnunculus TaxID=100819 RepID=A0A8C4U561_FALTI
AAWSCQVCLAWRFCLLPTGYLAEETSLQVALQGPGGCKGLTGLVEEQVRICQRQVEAMDAVKRGAELAAKECQHQFRSRRWNCSTLQGLQVFGTREAAFTHAISAAGIAFAVTRACSRGVMPPFRKVGNVLKEKFEGATELYPKRVGSRKLLVPTNSSFKPYAAHDLVYLFASPDFCDRAPGHGVFGTSGRQCNRTSPAMDGSRAGVVERSSCKFHWCGSVKCKQCRHLAEVHSCRGGAAGAEGSWGREVEEQGKV